MPITTRPAILTDLPTLLQFEQGVIDAERPMDIDLKRSHILYYDIEELIKTDHIELAVAVDGQELVGCGYARIQASKSYHTHDRHCYLGFMYTRPSHRGQGVNKLVIDHLKAWSMERGIDSLILEVYTTNPGAIRAYEKSGFDSRMIEMRMRL